MTDNFKDKTWKSFLDIKSNEALSDDEKAEKFIQLCSREAAAMGIHPNPKTYNCVDVYLLAPVQVYMTERLGNLRGEQVPASEIVVNLMKVIGLDILQRQAQLGLNKFGLPGIEVFGTIPLVYGLTYSIGKALDYLVINKEACPKEMKTLWENAYKEGREQGYSIEPEDLDYFDVLGYNGNNGSGCPMKR